MKKKIFRERYNEDGTQIIEAPKINFDETNDYKAEKTKKGKKNDKSNK